MLSPDCARGHSGERVPLEHCPPFIGRAAALPAVRLGAHSTRIRVRSREALACSAYLAVRPLARIARRRVSVLCPVVSAASSKL